MPFRYGLAIVFPLPIGEPPVSCGADALTILSSILLVLKELSFTWVESCTERR